jgi:DNA-binding NarL/FixJ family response regulator
VSDTSRGDARGPDLTVREVEVLQAIAHGKSTSSIADELSVAPRVVQSHVKQILGKLAVDSRVEAVLAAVRLGLIRPGRGSF